jgi:DNA-binding NarL/FixJ family response regulator
MNMPDARGIKVLLIEDHSLVRGLVANHLRRHLKDCEIIEADSLATLARLAEKIGGVRLAIVDLELPDGCAIEWIEGATTQYPELRMIVLSSVNQDVILYRALRCGVAGFVHKSDDLELLDSAIGAVLGGSAFLSPKIQRMRAMMSAQPDFYAKILSEREQAVLQSIAQGLSVSETASLLGISENAVHKHHLSVKGKLGIRNDHELTLYAVRKGFVSPDRSTAG